MLQDTITIQGLIQTGLIIVGLVSFAYALKGDISLLKHDIGTLQETQKSLTEAFSQLGSILTKVAVQDARMVSIEKSLDELRHGKGWIKE